MPKTGKQSPKKSTKASGKNTKSKVISKTKVAKSAKSTNAPPSPTQRKGSQKSASPKWAAPYEKKITMFKTQGDYFSLN
jgi:hypothetical protein